MDVEKVFHMNGGRGLTSYAENSSHQKRVADRVMPIIVEAIEETYFALKPKSIGIADLGCSSGPQELSKIKKVVEAVENASRMIQQQAPEFRVCLNDLSTNDFNTILKAVPDLYRELKKGREDGAPSVFVAAYPGSFYGRLFPNNSLHFIFSISSLHWLSRVPPDIYDGQGLPLNKKSIYISKNSPPQVCEAYLKQFRENFSLFLKSRSEEMISGGRMVLVLSGRNGPNFSDGGSTLFWEVLYQSFSTLVKKGLVEEEKLESYDVHYYEPCKEEIEDEVKEEGSFIVDRLEVQENENISMSNTSRGRAVAKEVRAIQESMIANHFDEAIMDTLFDEYGRLYDEMAAKEIFKSTNLALVLRKL